jgi:hypothetical protein
MAAVLAKHAACKENNKKWQDTQALFADSAEQNRKNCFLKVIAAKAINVLLTENVQLREKIRKLARENVLNMAFSFVRNRRLSVCTVW